MQGGLADVLREYYAEHGEYPEFDPSQGPRIMRTRRRNDGETS
jgi:hypothetical protein